MELVAHSSRYFRLTLVVDDNFIDTNGVLQKMEAISYLAACKQSGLYPEVILLDVDMPVMNGFAFLEQCFTEKLFRGLLDFVATEEMSVWEKEKIRLVGVTLR